LPFSSGINTLGAMEAVYSHFAIMLNMATYSEIAAIAAKTIPPAIMSFNGILYSLG
jgi:hypothetical protein